MTIDTSKIKLSTKSVAGIVAVAGSLWQVQQVHDTVLKFVQAHPHWSGLIGVVGTLWALLHNPQVQEILGIECAK